MAKYFIELYPYAHNTGDLDAWQGLSHPECVFCESVRESVKSIHDAGNHVVGGEVTWVDDNPKVDVDGEIFEVSLAVDQAAATTVSSTGEVVSSSASVRGTTIVFLLDVVPNPRVRGVIFEAKPAD